MWNESIKYNTLHAWTLLHLERAHSTAADMGHVLHSRSRITLTQYSAVVLPAETDVAPPLAECWGAPQHSASGGATSRGFGVPLSVFCLDALATSPKGLLIGSVPLRQIGVDRHPHPDLDPGVCIGLHASRGRPCVQCDKITRVSTRTPQVPHLITTPFQRGDRIYTSESDVCIRQILTYEDYPST